MRNNHFDYNPNRYRGYDEPQEKSEWSKLHMFFGGAIFLTFFLCLWLGAMNKNDPDGAMQLALYPYKDASQLARKIEELDHTAPVKVAEPEEFYTWLAQVRIAQNAVDDFARYGILPAQTAATFTNRLQDIDHKGADASEIRRFAPGLTASVQEKVLYPTIDAARIPVDRTPLWQSLALAYSISCALLFFMMCYKGKKKGFNFIGEMFTFTRLPLAIPTSLITAWKYPFGEPVKSLKSAMKVAAYVLASILSMGVAGGAKAFGQNGSTKSGKGKATADWNIQADARYGEIVAGTGPNPQRSLRITITSPNGWVSENIFGSNNLQANALISGGKRFLKTTHTTLIGVAGFRQTHDKIRGSDSTSLTAGIQIFNTFALPKKFPLFSTINTNTPVINFERTVRGSPGNRHLNFTTVNQTFAKSKLDAKHGGLFVGWETVISKTATKPLGWTVGPLLEYKFPRKNWPRVGIGYLWNQLGTGIWRLRLTQNLSF